jgi:hypothetical protein
MTPAPPPVLVFNYPAGNEHARQQQETNAAKIIGYQVVVRPRDPRHIWSAVETIPAPTPETETRS